ncbi:hypothetical protein WMY93_008864 [Mugilogobius chulae]|uniref:Uncharacterized protein n=1 Tax=Mugilogobius chulae TaxID=88201 RepID=A0AAW0PD80_9GOBI
MLRLVLLIHGETEEEAVVERQSVCCSPEQPMKVTSRCRRSSSARLALDSCLGSDNQAGWGLANERARLPSGHGFQERSRIPDAELKEVKPPSDNEIQDPGTPPSDLHRSASDEKQLERAKPPSGLQCLRLVSLTRTQSTDLQSWRTASAALGNVSFTCTETEDKSVLGSLQ